MNHQSSKSLLHTHQKDTVQTENAQTEIWKEAPGYIFVKQFIWWESSEVTIYSSQWLVTVLEFS